MNNTTRTPKFRVGWIALVIFLAVPYPATTEPAVPDNPSEQKFDTMPVLEMVERALVDTLYYRFDEWFSRFKRRIKQLEALPPTLVNRLELMRFYFNLAGLYGELTHALSFTETYQVEEVKKEFQYYSSKSYALAEELLDEGQLSKADRADAYFYLGASEGYMALLEYGEGSLLSALVDGLSADNHLEDALELDPDHADAHVGLGIYRYGNTRIGGLGNLIMQGGSDLRLVGLRHLETALEHKIVSRPLALKTLTWFYISEQINPGNANLPDGDPLSRYTTRSRALFLLDQYERQYFTDVPEGFIGNKGLTMMKGIQLVINRDYAQALKQFEINLKICNALVNVDGFKINPQYIDTVKAVIQFCKLMLTAGAENARPNPKSCAPVKEQIEFIESGGSVIQYQSSKIRGEIQNMFHRRLKKLAARMNC